jgi:hypothetical protein
MSIGLVAGKCLDFCLAASAWMDTSVIRSIESKRARREQAQLSAAMDRATENG